MTALESYKMAVKEVQAALSEGRRLAGALRSQWGNLAPALDSRLVSSRDLASDLDQKPNTVKKAITRIRKEVGSSPAPAGRPGLGEAGQPPSPAQEKEDRKEPGGLLSMYEQSKGPDSASSVDKESEIAREFASRERKQEKSVLSKYGKIDSE